MSRESGFPSMTALLGLLAVAGFQNRDKIAELLKGAMPGGSGGEAPKGGQLSGGAGGGQLAGGLPGGLGGQLPGGLGGLLGGLAGGGAGGLLSGGLGELLERFTQSGQGDVAESWIGTGPNKDVAPQQVEQAIGSDVLEALSEQTGLSQSEILARLSRELPKAVDQYTPEGRLPRGL